MNLRRRAIPLSVEVNARPLRRQVFRVARSLAEEDVEDARLSIAELSQRRDSWLPEDPAEPAPAPLLRALALCSILLDLYEGGWDIEIEAAQIYLLAPQDHEPGESMTPDELLSAKERIRRSAVARVRAQLAEPGAGRLARDLESGGIHRLIAGGSALAEALEREGAQAVRPYLQLARREDGSDSITGLPLYEVFRYFRYTWSFPYQDTPGRSLPILIRDAGQPDHPVCGLLCLSSPVLRLGARDAFLGLTPDWLEALVLALDVPLSEDDPEGLRECIEQHLLGVEAACAARTSRAREAVSPQRVLSAMATLLEVSAPPRARPLARQLAALRLAGLRARLEAVLVRITEALRGELEDAVRGYSLDGLPVDAADLIQDPEACLEPLLRCSEAAQEERRRLLMQRQREQEAAAQRARQAWAPLLVLRGEIPADALESFQVPPAHAPLTPSLLRRRVSEYLRSLDVAERAEQETRWQGLREVAEERFQDSEHHRRRARQISRQATSTLFIRKRAAQLAALLPGWAELRPLTHALRADVARLERLQDALRTATSSRKRGDYLLSGGKHAARCVREAMLQRKTRLLASQILDASLCGALPPYGDLLGGKLVALLALSREAAQLYRAVYAGRESEIQTRLAGQSVVRPTDLLAITTTGFFGVGSAQYSRLRFSTPAGEYRWDRAGLSRGFGSLHFSSQTTDLLSELVLRETGMRHINSTFGEGPSERLRKLRDGLFRLGLSSDELLRHGMSRLVYVARLQGGLGLEEPTANQPHHLAGPTVEDIAVSWRERWLAPRLTDKIPALHDFSPEDVLLSTRYPDELRQAWTRLADGEE